MSIDKRINSGSQQKKSVENCPTYELTSFFVGEEERMKKNKFCLF